MANKKQTRRALFMSVISLVLCMAMLVGTTFAWFTDEVASGRNTIAAGNLDVELYADGAQVTGETILFNDVEPNLWEPGAVAYENLQVKNVGNLALKYNLNLSVLNETVVNEHKLSDVIMVGIVDDGITSKDRNEVVNSVSTWTKLSEFNLNMNGKELAAETDDEMFGIVLYWAPNDNDIDNLYNLNNGQEGVLQLDIGVNLYATQVKAESDSFGPDYDADAEHGSSASVTVPADKGVTLQVPVAPSDVTKMTAIAVPAGAYAADTELAIDVTATNTLFNVNSEGAVVASLNVTLLVNGEENSEELADGVYTVTTYISTGLTDVSVKYTGTDGKADVDQTTVTYDPVTGKLTFKTNHFSEYEVSAKAFGYTDDAAYGTAQDAADAITDGTKVNVAESDKEAVLEASGDSKDVLAALATVKVGNTNYLTLAEAMENVATNGSQITKVTLVADAAIDAGVTVPAGAIVKLDLGGYTLSATSNTAAASCAINNKGQLTIMNGTVTYQGIGDPNFGYGTNTVNNTGKLTIDGASIINTTNSGSSVAIDCSAGADLTVNSGKIQSEKNAIRLCPFGDAAIKCTINGGEITGARAIQIQLPSNKPESAPAIELIVNDGVLTGKGGLALYSYSAGQSFENVKINLKGGTYNNEVAFGGGAKTTTETVEISKNCVFNADVYRYLANDGIEYLVSDGIYESSEELSLTLSAGGSVVLTDSINDATVATTAPSGNHYGIALNGGVLDGNGKTLDFDMGTKNAEGKYDNYGIMTSGGTIKNVTITGVFRGIMIMNPTEDIIIDNVVIGDEDVCYAINTGEGNGTYDLIVKNSTIKGWSSYGTAIKSVSFTDCTFAQGTYYDDVYGRLVKPYVDTVFENCEFNSMFYIDLSQLGKDGDGNVLTPDTKITLKNCTVNGVKLTAENWKDLIVSESDCGEGQISIELKDGSYLTADNVVNYVIFE